MPDSPRAPVPSPQLDRAAIERVLARAAELQMAGGTTSGEGGGLSESDVLDVARQAGLSVEHVRHALAEERVRTALAPVGGIDEHGLAVRLAGPGRIGAARVIAGTPGEAMARITRLLEREECMRSVRQLPDRGSWEPRRDLIGNLDRAFRRGGGTPALRTVASLVAVVLPVEEGRVLVRFEADLSASRRQRLAVGGVTAASGALAGASLLTMGVVADALMAVVAPLAALPLLAGGGTAWALARGHRARLARTHEALEQLLDRVEHAPPPSSAPGARARATPSLIQVVLDDVRRALD
jgi:hypothetical protein